MLLVNLLHLVILFVHNNIFFFFFQFFQIILRLSQMKSLEDFCSTILLDPTDIFILPPESSWNSTNWIKRLCTLDISNLLKEVNETSYIMEIENIVRKYLNFFSASNIIQKSVPK